MWGWSWMTVVRSRAGRFTIKCTGVYLCIFTCPETTVPVGFLGTWPRIENLALLGIRTTASVIMEVTHASKEAIRYHVYTYIGPHVQTYIYAHTHRSLPIYMHMSNTGSFKVPFCVNRRPRLVNLKIKDVHYVWEVTDFYSVSMLT